MVDRDCCFVVLLLLGGLACGQDEGFLSVNCGGAGCNEVSTGIDYVSDAPYVTSGVNRIIKREFKGELPRHLWDLRSFPEGKRNCYYFNATKGDKYLIRAKFAYGNFDGMDNPPKFDLYIQSVYHQTVTFDDTTARQSIVEVIHELQSRHLDVCVAKIDSSVPFISTLELRRLSKDSYNSKGLLQSANRYAMGSTSKNMSLGDSFDRRWDYRDSYSWSFHGTKKLKTMQRVRTTPAYQEPQLSMQTAVTPINVSDSLKITLSVPYSDEAYVYMYFAELLELGDGESREFSIYYNGYILAAPFSPVYLETTMISSTSPLAKSTDGTYNFLLQKTESSTLPLLINAIEVYILRNFSGKDTNEGDVTAIRNVKLSYRLNITNWQGDPCSPLTFMWDGVKCNNDSNSTPRITSLNLSSSRLEGVITPAIVDINQLVVL